MKPLCVDLYCGLGGWASGFLAEGYDVIGFDIERRPYPAQLVLQDVLTLHGSQFKDAAVIVASPPCQAYSYRAMPWKRAKALPPPDNTLFEACFRIQKEASEATGWYIPIIVENVCGAQRWVGPAKWHFGSFYLWGDVPALMPITRRVKTSTRLAPGKHGKWTYSVADELKLPGNNEPRRWEDRSVQRSDDATKNNGGSWFAIANNTTSGHSKNPVHILVEAQSEAGSGLKQGGEWWHDPQSITRTTWSTSLARKAASAQIAKIPFPLARHIARVFKP